MNLRWLLAGVEKFVGSRLDPLRLIGGGSQMDVWCQIPPTCDRPWSGRRAARRGCWRGIFAGLALGEVPEADVRARSPSTGPSLPTRPTARSMTVSSRSSPSSMAQQGMFAALNR